MPTPDIGCMGSESMTMTSILEVLPAQFRAALRGLDWDKIQELRLRSGYPLGIKRVGEREAAHNAAHDPAHDAAGVVRAEDVAAVLAAATRQSAYSAQETLREGYLTLEGGHRVGVCGTLVLRGGEPYSMKDVTSLNIRVAHDIRMDSARLLPYLRENLLIIGVPGSGKTTLLRACIRTLSQMGQCVSVADERGEIAAFPLGSRVDVLRGCGKQAAMERLLHSPLLGGADKLGEADAVIFTLLGGPELSLGETKQLLELAGRQVKPETRLIVGAATGEEWAGKLMLSAVTVRFDAESEASELLRSSSERAPKRTRSAAAHAADADQLILPLEPISKGVMERGPQVKWGNDDLDVPTFKRRNITIDNGKRGVEQ